MATILVADDDHLLRAILRDHLEHAGHDVLDAGDGIAAIDIALADRPDLLVLDVMMPLARGLEVVRRVRGEEAWHPPIVMLSARTRAADRLNAIDAGADAYVEKPFAPDALLEEIEYLLSDAPAARYVDILGPVWTGVAIERLARDAMSRRTRAPAAPDQLGALFATILADTTGRRDPARGRNEAFHPLRLMWEDTLRGLLRDATEPVPVVAADVDVPGAIAAVARVIGDETLARARRGGGPDAALAGLWDGVLGGVLGAATGDGRRARPPAPEAARWSALLREILGDGGRPGPAGGRWEDVLAGVLGRMGPAPGLDPVERVWLAMAERAMRGVPA